MLTNSAFYITSAAKGTMNSRPTMVGVSKEPCANLTNVTTIRGQQALNDNATTVGISTVKFNYVKLGRRHDRRPNGRRTVTLVHRTVRHNMALFSATRDCNCRGGRGLVKRTLGNCRKHIFISSGFKRGFMGNIRVGARRSDAPTGVHQIYRGSLHGLNIRALNVFCRRHVSPGASIRMITSAIGRLVQRKGMLRFKLYRIGTRAVHHTRTIYPIATVRDRCRFVRHGMRRGMLPIYRRLNVNFIPCDPLGQKFLNNVVGRCAQFRTTGSGHRALPHFRPSTVHTGVHVIRMLGIFNEAEKVAPTRITLT